MAPPLATALSPLSPHALLGRPACYTLRKSARSFFFVARACCVCRSLQAARLSALLLLLFFFVRSIFLQSALSRVAAGGLEFRFREIRLPECVDSSFSRLLSLSLLLLRLWVLPTPPFLGGWSYCLGRIYRLSKSLFILFYLVGPLRRRRRRRRRRAPLIY